MNKWSIVIGLTVLAGLVGCASLRASHKQAEAVNKLHVLKISRGDAIGRPVGREAPDKPFSTMTAVEYLRPEAPDCGLPSQPMTIYPGMGGDLVRVTGSGSFDIFDEGDTGTGPTPENHDRLVLPGFPSEAEVLVRNGSVAICVPGYQYSVLLIRQRCSGQGWNNSIEAINFTGGASFVSQDILDQIDGPYMTAERAAALELDWVSEKGLANWAVYPMPGKMLPPAGGLKACAHEVPRPADG